MDECSVIEVFGTTEFPERVVAFAEAAACEGLGEDWLNAMSTDEIIGSVVDAAEEGNWLRLVKDFSGDLSAVRQALRIAGLSYIHSTGISGDDGYHSAIYWKPGMVREFEAGLLNGMDVGISLKQLQEAQLEGPNGVQDLIRNFATFTLDNVEKKLALSEEVIAELKQPTLTA